MELGEHDLVSRFHARAAFDVQREDSVGTRRGGIQIVSADGLVHLALEQAVQGFLLSVTDRLGEAADSDTTTLVVSDLQVLVLVYLTSACIWK